MRWLRHRRAGGRQRAPGQGELHVADPRFDDWEVVGDFDSVDAARAYRQHLDEAGLEAVITADHPLDRLGRGDIALRVPPGRWSEADEFLTGLDVDE